MYKSSMVAQAYNPNNQEPSQGHHEIEASLGYIERTHLQVKKK